MSELSGWKCPRILGALVFKNVRIIWLKMSKKSGGISVQKCQNYLVENVQDFNQNSWFGWFLCSSRISTKIRDLVGFYALVQFQPKFAIFCLLFQLFVYNFSCLFTFFVSWLFTFVSCFVYIFSYLFTISAVYLQLALKSLFSNDFFATIPSLKLQMSADCLQFQLFVYFLSAVLFTFSAICLHFQLFVYIVSSLFTFLSADCLLFHICLGELGFKTPSSGQNLH